MEHLSNDHEDHPNQQENGHKPCIETGYPVLGLSESQWKLKQHATRINQWRKSPWATNTSVRRKNEIQKRRTVRITVMDLSKNVNYLSKVA